MHNMHDLRVSDGKKSKRAAKRRINIGYAAVKVAHCGGSHHINANKHHAKASDGRQGGEPGGTGGHADGRNTRTSVAVLHSRKLTVFNVRQRR